MQTLSLTKTNTMIKSLCQYWGTLELCGVVWGWIDLPTIELLEGMVLQDGISSNSFILVPLSKFLLTLQITYIYLAFFYVDFKPNFYLPNLSQLSLNLCGYQNHLEVMLKDTLLGPIPEVSGFGEGLRSHIAFNFSGDVKAAMGGGGGGNHILITTVLNNSILEIMALL